ncbi:MAG TPA: hypothetical protein VIS06_22665 [Mycobacteriales bacterium]
MNSEKGGEVRGRDAERSVLAGWPGDHEADLYRDGRRDRYRDGGRDGGGDGGPLRGGDRGRPVEPVTPAEPVRPVGARDPQRDVWDAAE